MNAEPKPPCQRCKLGVRLYIHNGVLIHRDWDNGDMTDYLCESKCPSCAAKDAEIVKSAMFFRTLHLMANWHDHATTCNSLRSWPGTRCPCDCGLDLAQELTGIKEKGESQLDPEFERGWALAHESAKCGHARANWRDSNYGSEAYSGDEKCEVCAEMERLKADHAAALRQQRMEDLSRAVKAVTSFDFDANGGSQAMWPFVAEVVRVIRAAFAPVLAGEGKEGGADAK